MARVGFVGLGTVGAPMAGHLAKAGHDLWVWNRTTSKVGPLVQAGAKAAGSLPDLAAQCEFVFLCVNRNEDVEECLEALTATAKPGTIFVDHSTIEPSAAVRFHDRLKAQGFDFVDAPITGGSMGAINGTLTIFLGGEEETVNKVKPIVSAYAKRAERVGGPGAGQRMKMVNQIAVAGSLLALCESLSFAKKAGLDLTQTKELVGSGAAGSWSFENYGPKILREDWSPGFSVKNQRKDLEYCNAAAREINAAIPGAQLTDRLLAILESNGRGEEATAALFDAMAQMEFEN